MAVEVAVVVWVLVIEVVTLVVCEDVTVVVVGVVVCDMTMECTWKARKHVSD
jgi:hypothetical protein